MPEYDFNEKGAEFLEAFVDPGPPYDPADGPSDRFFREITEHTSAFTMAFQHDGTITYASSAIEFLLGYTRAELLGTNALDLIHPDDLQNAADTVYHAAEIEGWRPPRPFRLVHKDGTDAMFDVEGMSLFHIDEVRSIVCIARYAESTGRVDAIVGLLAANAPLAAILDELVHLMAQPGWRFGVAIQYDDGPGTLPIAHTGLPDALLQFDRDDLTTPWGRACHTGEPVYDLGFQTLTPELAATARDAGFQTIWAIPVPDAGREQTCIVVWNYELHPPELGQALLLRKLQQLLELALAGRARSVQLERDARTDVLSGLANRRSFEAALETNDQDDVAVLFIDLDGFKGVNDALGHAAGDEVIRKVGARILAAIRHVDLAARFGGDEFAILCRDVRRESDVHRLAERLLETVAQPIELLEGRAEFGLSIGIALATPGSPPQLEQLLDVADKQLYAAKHGGRGQYRSARVAPVDPASPA